MKILPNIKSPQDLKKLSLEELSRLSQEIREEIINVVSQRGGHLSSNLGTVELIIGLHYVLNTPEDKIVWDVGHQAYTHKLLTGRFFSFGTLRKFGGLSGFPNIEESPYDVFTVGHGSTAISQALGMACARDLRGTNEKIVAVIGDGSLQGGMAFEALNQVGHLQKDILVILNDNEWFISPGIGAMSKYLNRILTNPIYNRIHKDVENLMKKIPRFGFRAYLSARKLEKSLKNLLVPGIIFEELGFRYLGPFDGHDLHILIPALKNIIEIKGPCIMHVVTKKGKGFKPAEDNPTFFHSAPPFEVKSGMPLGDKGKMTFTRTFGEKIVKLAEEDSRIVAITAAMTDGTGLTSFAKKFPQRFFDVGMAEEHAVTFAGGLARGGFIPIVAIYSTFLQRAYDQIIHDVCLQKLPVVFCIDRAGIVGEDGPTHHGVFDLSYLTHIPNMVVMAPKDFKELEKMLEFAVKANRTIAIRYPRGGLVFSRELLASEEIEMGKAEILKEGNDLAILAVGSMVYPAFEAVKMLLKEGIDAELVNMRFVKPLDKDLLKKLGKNFNHFITIEENSLIGGFASQILSFFEEEGLEGRRILTLGLPDRFITHGGREEILEICGLSPIRIKEAIFSWFRGVNNFYIDKKNELYQNK
ncbi:MAG: 1-deoxy-D-xylulose-5-phosphate synthase [Candidatus Omnitrophota bacterium]